MRIITVAALAMFCALSCVANTEQATEQAADDEGTAIAAGKGDGTYEVDLERASQFFVTQIHDETWNPDGVTDDLLSNNCGPASLAMVVAERGLLPDGLSAEEAIDHARALMYPGYPDIAVEALSEGALRYSEGDVVFVDDDSTKVYFETGDDEPSVVRGILHAGGVAAVGHSWDFLDQYLGAGQPVIAYGHITSGWISRFPGEYGEVSSGAVPHFIAVFASTAGDAYIVSDPLHHGGAVAMTRAQLAGFFTSPVNVFDTTIRLIAWDTASPAAGSPHE